MSDSADATRPRSATAWLIPALAAGVVAAAVISYGRSEERQAASGSPYYGKAVQEAINGLKNPGGANASPAARPPLAAGLSPDEHYWCENCKTYHKRDAAQPVPAAEIPQAGTVPPLPDGLSRDDHYWCANCKAYHKRQPGGTAPPADWEGVPYQLPHP